MMAETKMPHPLSIEGRELRLNELLDRVAATPDGKDLAALHELTNLLPDCDGDPLETAWHRMQMNLLLDSIYVHWSDHDHYYAGGNMFVYFDPKGLKNQNFRGPDVFVVRDVDGRRIRRFWAVWEENWRLPDVVIELMSPTTRETDLTTKKDIYAKVWKTAEYFCYDPDTLELQGWTRNVSTGEYEPKLPNERGQLQSQQLGAWVGLWNGIYRERNHLLRLFDNAGGLVPIPEEAERARALQASERVHELGQQFELQMERHAHVLEEIALSQERMRVAQKENEELRRLLKLALGRLDTNPPAAESDVEQS